MEFLSYCNAIFCTNFCILFLNYHLIIIIFVIENDAVV